MLIDTGIDPRIAKAEKIAAVESQQAESRRGKVIFSTVWEEYLKELKMGISAKTKRPYRKSGAALWALIIQTTRP